MALINCSECGKEISDKAKTCPNCGYKLKRIKSISPRMKVAILSVSAVVIVVIGLAVWLLMQRRSR